MINKSKVQGGSGGVAPLASKLFRETCEPDKHNHGWYRHLVCNALDITSSDVRLTARDPIKRAIEEDINGQEREDNGPMP